MSKKKNEDTELWEGISEKDFINESNIINTDIAKYDIDNMVIFSANINYFRQIIRLSDSLKPVERRILYAMKEANLKPGTSKKKSQSIIGDVGKFHAHLEPYKSLVNMAQPWKKPCPLIEGKGNFGSDQYPDIFAAMRYTEATISKYAYECFFEDYDVECVEMLFNSASDSEEPMSLPSKFPNILVNGGIGIAIGNAFCIPPYNINDIIDNTKKILNDPSADVFMIPDIPTGCAVVDDGAIFHEIAEKGTGSLKMRSTINILENKNYWVLEVTSLPWMVSLTNINEQMIKLKNEGIPIYDIQNVSIPVKKPDGTLRTNIRYNILIEKQYDPNEIIQKLYSRTYLERTFGVNFKVVLDELVVRKLSLKDLLSAWLDERRSYKRRLYNKRLRKISARIDLLEILIRLLNKDNLNKTIDIIKNSDVSIVKNKLMKLGKMNSHQADEIIRMPMSAFTADKRKAYKEEKKKKEEEKDSIMKIIGSEDAIDAIIENELEDLRKYAKPRLSPIVKDNGSYVSDATYNIIISKQGYIKKLPFLGKGNPKNYYYGAFHKLDAPINHMTLSNLSNIMLFDVYGRMSSIAVSDIPVCEPNNYGNKIYDISGLRGEIIFSIEHLTYDLDEFLDKHNSEAYVVSLTKNAYIKKSSLSNYLNLRTKKNVKAIRLKDNDTLVDCNIILKGIIIAIYTKKGKFTIIEIDSLISQGRDTTGVLGIKLDNGDECQGFCVVGPKDKYLVVLTNKGHMKRVEMEYSGGVKKRPSSGLILSSLEKNETIYSVHSVREKDSIEVIHTAGIETIPVSEIPILTRRAMPKKKISLGNTGKIVKSSISNK